LKMAAFVQ